MQKDARHAGVPYSMKSIEPGRFKPMYWPPRFNYSLEALREVDEKQYSFVINVLEDVAENDFKLSGQALEIHNSYMDYIFKSGLIKPNIEEEEDGYMVYFTVWSFFNKKYVSYGELTLFESRYLDFFFDRLFSVN